MSALSLPKSLISRLAEAAGLGTARPEATERATSDSREHEAVPKEEKEEGGNDDGDGEASTSTLSPLSDVAEFALVLPLDNLSPRELALASLSCHRLRDVACSGVCWRTRFEPRLPEAVSRRLDDAEREARGRRGASTATTGKGSSRSSSSSSCSSFFGWPSTYAALSLSNLLRSPLEWDGVSRGMRASYYDADERDEGDEEEDDDEEAEEDEDDEAEGGSEERRRRRRRRPRRRRRGRTSVSSCVSDPPWRVTCHGGHGWEVEREGPAGADEEIIESSSGGGGGGGSSWPPALLPRSSLSLSSSSPSAALPSAAVAAASSSSSQPSSSSSSSSSWLRRSLHLGSASSSSSSSSAPPTPSLLPRPLSVAASFSWCEIVQEVDLVFELCRATSWVECSVADAESEKESDESDDDGDGDGDDDGDDNKSRRRRRTRSKRTTTRNLSWAREDAESYLDSSAAAAEPPSSSSSSSASPLKSQACSPRLVLSFSCASRRDCESQFSAQLLALPDTKETGPLPPYHGRPNYDWASRAKALAVSELSERAAPWERGGGKGKWHRVTLPPLALPAGTRRALVVLRSKDSRFWSGHYGAKFAAPVLAFAATPVEVEAAESAAAETEALREEAAAARELLFAP